MLFRHTYVNPLSRKRHGDWTWCFRCECVYRTTEWCANHWFCPHPGCDGTAHDASRWRQKNEPPFDLHPEYPEVPVAGRRYAWRQPEPEKYQPRRAWWQTVHADRAGQTSAASQPPGNSTQYTPQEEIHGKRPTYDRR